MGGKKSLWEFLVSKKIEKRISIVYFFELEIFNNSELLFEIHY